MDVSNNTRVSKVVQGIVNNEVADSRGMKDGKVSVFEFCPKEVGIGEGTGIERNGVEGCIF